MRRDDRKFTFYFKKIILLLTIMVVSIVCYLFVIYNLVDNINTLVDKHMAVGVSSVSTEFKNEINVIVMQLTVVSFGIVVFIGFLLQMTYRKKSTHENNIANTVMFKLKTALLEINKNGYITASNPYAENLFNLKAYKSDKYINFYDIIFEPDKKIAASMIKKYLGGIASVNYTLRSLAQNGNTIHVLWSFCGADDDGNITLIGTNQTENLIFEQKLHMSQERYILSTQMANDIFYELDLKSNVLTLWDKFRELTGHSKLDYSMDEYLETLVCADDRDCVREFLEQFRRKEKQICEIEHRLLKSDGSNIWIRVGAALLNPSGNDNAYLVGSLTDINEAKVNDLRIKHMAYYDPLTLLPNRLKFMESVTSSLSENEKAVMFYIDIDNFKFINDNFGHSKGDELLITIAQIFKRVISGNNIVARLGGDEFGMFFDDISTEEQAVLKAKEVLALFEDMVRNSPLFSRISPSIGVVICPQGGREYNEILNNADIAMYAAKKMGKCCLKIFEPSMKKDIAELSEIEYHLNKAIEKGELFLVYQPIYSNLKKEVVGFEALLRWNSPIYGIVMPGKIVSIAEQGTLIYTIGYWVLEQAATYLKKLEGLGKTNFEVSINISSKQLLRDDFIQNVIRIISKVGADPTNIVFEIDQRVTFDNYEILENIMIELKKFGIKFSLDDVSSHIKKLVSLMQLPFSTIKLDVKLSHPGLFDIGNTSLIESIVSLAKKHSVSILVESVEDKDMIDKIFISYAERLQGYALSYPIDEESTYKILNQTPDIDIEGSVNQ